MDETELKDLARINLRSDLGGVSGVVAPAVFGGKDRTVLIYIDPKKLQARNLSPLDVVEALQRENLMTTPGVAKMGPYEFQLDSNAMVRTVDELNDIPIRIEPGNRDLPPRRGARHGFALLSRPLSSTSTAVAASTSLSTASRGRPAASDVVQAVDGVQEEMQNNLQTASGTRRSS